MVFKPRYFLSMAFVSLLSLSLLTSCVSVNNKALMVSNANAATVELLSCDIEPVMQKKQMNVKALNPEHIALLNWNIYKGNGENWQHDLSVFAQDHDVMTIQEATLDEEFTGLLAQNDFNWVMNTAFYLNGTAAGVMTVASADALHSCGFKVKEPIIRIPKSTLVSYYAIDGSEEQLLVANIHGINFTLGLDAYHEQLDKLYDAVIQHDGPIIIAGDFNSWSSDRLSEVHRLVERLSLSSIEYPVNNKTHMFGNAIDHVFYRQLELVSNKVWQVSSSDHNPISVSFRYQPMAVSQRSDMQQPEPI
jgi:endonuclease/exonuclease/phosphatase (EEP) superfamily protein YafD